MNRDLEWLARDVSEWPDDCHWVARVDTRSGDQALFWPKDMQPSAFRSFTRDQWQAARIELGLDPTPEEDEAWAKLDERLGRKQARYQDRNGEDWIDEFARTATPEEFRGAMRFTLGKYVRRAGKKDAIESEIEKIRDYAARWLEVEQSR